MTEQLQIQLVKLADGGRLLRLSEKTSGLCLEKRLADQEPVVRQKTHLLHDFKQLLAQKRQASHCPS